MAQEIGPERIDGGDPLPGRSWEDEARVYAGNADYWRKRNEETEALLADANKLLALEQKYISDLYELRDSEWREGAGH
jgi:hypothetical protein